MLMPEIQNDMSEMQRMSLQVIITIILVDDTISMNYVR